MKRELPITVVDVAGVEYRLVRGEIQLPEGKSMPALYDKVPEDPKAHFTPDLAFCLGQVDTPIMHRIES